MFCFLWVFVGVGVVVGFGVFEILVGRCCGGCGCCDMWVFWFVVCLTLKNGAKNQGGLLFWVFDYSIKGCKQKMFLYNNV